MKTFIKILLVIAGASFAFGMIFFCIGLGFGGFQLKQTIKGWTTVTYDDYDKDFVGEVKDIEIELGAGEISIVRGDKFNLKATGVVSGAFDNARIDEEGTLRIEDDSSYTLFNLVEYSGKVTITIPEGFEAEKIYIGTGAGDITITDLTATEDISFDFGAGNAVLGDITAGDEVYIKTGAGNVTSRNITGANVQLDTGVGEYSALGKITATDVTVNTGVGKVNLGDIKADNLNLSGGVGEIFVKNADVILGDINVGTGTFIMTAKVAETLNYDGGVGSGDITIIGEENDFRISVSQGAGDVTVGDNTYSSAGGNFTTGNAQGTKKIDIDAGVGDFEIRFVAETVAEAVPEDKAA